MIYNKINNIILGLLSFTFANAYYFDFFDQEIVIDYEPTQSKDSFISSDHNIQIDLYQENNYIEANSYINLESRSEQVKHFTIFNVFNEPDKIFFNDVQLEYLNWYYNHDEHSIEIVNIDHDISNSFIIEWSDDDVFTQE